MLTPAPIIVLTVFQLERKHGGFHSNGFIPLLTVGLLDQLNAMNLRLEDIQKSLDNYLETKRQTFPRFYFISNDDLLEMLGQSKNPMEIQVHLKKCFDNIKSLNMSRASRLFIYLAPSHRM